MSTLREPNHTKRDTTWDGKPDRTFTSRWVTEITEEDLGKEVTVVVDLYTSHDKERGQYESGVYKRRIGGGITRTEFSVMSRKPEPDTVSRVYTDTAGPRFSAKTLEAAHREHLALFMHHPAVKATHLQRLIDPNGPSTHL